MNLFGIFAVVFLFVLIPVAACVHESWLRRHSHIDLEPNELSTVRRLRIVRTLLGVPTPNVKNRTLANRGRTGKLA